MEDHFSSFIIFIICNILFGLSGLAIIGGVIYLIIKTTFNSLSFMLIVIGLIIILISVLGINIRKKYNLIIIYLILVAIIFSFFIGLAIMFKGFPDKIIEYLKDKVNDYDNEIDKIKKYKNNLFVSASIGGFCSLIAFITALTYYIKTKNKNRENNDNDNKDVILNIDYTQYSINQIK